MSAALIVALAMLTAAGPADPAAAPLLRARLEVPVVWRAASVKPDIGPAIDYGTDTPGAGWQLDVTVAPLRALGRWRWLAPLEIDLEMSQRFASVLVSGAGPGALGAREQRASLDLLYPVPMGAMTLAPRVGYGIHLFDIDRDPLPRSARHGVRVGIDVSHPLPLSTWGDAFARAFPTMGPGADERAALGPDGNGWGFQVGVAVRRVISGALGWRLGYDFVHFSDSHAGAGTRSVGGHGETSYHTMTAGLTFTR